jgi:hypothetical protein
MQGLGCCVCSSDLLQQCLGRQLLLRLGLLWGRLHSGDGLLQWLPSFCAIFQTTGKQQEGDNITIMLCICC